MHAIVRPSRIDIEGANAVAAEVWQPMLDELKAEHVPGLTPTGKRMMVAVGPSGRMDGFIYRTTVMADEDVVHPVPEGSALSQIDSVGEQRGADHLLCARKDPRVGRTTAVVDNDDGGRIAEPQALQQTAKRVRRTVRRNQENDRRRLGWAAFRERSRGLIVGRHGWHSEMSGWMVWGV